MGKIYEDLTKTVGNTPLVRLNRVTKGLDATVAAKLNTSTLWEALRTE